MKPYIEFNIQKRIQVENDNDKDGKALYKLKNNGIQGKTIKNLRNRIDVKLVNNQKLFKMYLKTKLYVAQNIWQ